jgi:hypothetical protein
MISPTGDPMPYCFSEYRLLLLVLLVLVLVLLVIL